MSYRPSQENRRHLSSIELTSSCTDSEESQLRPRDNTLPYPPGLANLGNTCYINATLQCLLTIQPLVDWLISQPERLYHQNPNPDSPLLTPVLSKLVVAIFQNNYNFELEEFRRVIGELVKDFKEPREQDAQEFLLFLLNRLHDETVDYHNARGPATSEILRIFEGTLQTQLSYQQRKKKGYFFRYKPSPNETKGNSEVFLSLSVPIPVSGNKLKAATDLLDSNACDLNIVFNEIFNGNSALFTLVLLSLQSVCFRRLLKVHPSTDIQSVYNQVLSFPPIGSTATSAASPSSLTSLQTSGGGYPRNPKESTYEEFLSASSSLSDPFILVQAKSTGFGEWFLESSGLAVDLTDGLNMEDDFFTNSHVLETVKRSLLNGDALFIVRLNSKPPSEETQLTSSSFSLNKTSNLDIDAGQQVLNSSSSSAVESRMQLLLIHVEERENRKLFHSPSEDNNVARAASFRRFSPPLSVNVPNDIRFDCLRLLALQSLLDICDNRPLTESMLTSESYRNVCFWIVDAAPGEPCELDSRQEFPLLHSTIEVSSITLPKWLSTEKGESPRLLRLLVVWPSLPVDPMRTFKVNTDLALKAFLTDPNVASDCNSRFTKSNSFEDADLTIRRCLEEFIKTANVTHTQPCDTNEKNPTTVVLNTWLEKAPKYLILHLNRFVHVPASSAGYCRPLHFSTDRGNRNLSNNDSSKLVYDLVAVCNHKGSIETGHITAYCKSLVSGQWWHYNDLKVQKVSPDQVVQPGAYILFYKKRNADVGDIRETVKKLYEISKGGRDREVASRSPSSVTPATRKRTSSTRPSTLFSWLLKRPRR
ncbi:unnamed protein product [Hydatigera taeniaeformis]|uniref:ubiquitinyl hydrolase 1 n=1 Tax=Hydatigena taeniaeformis TaxID=6205 RepID=A0A158RF08_HYDTA|nr:unnamed protein product [Hydatigera taeniaeformis]